VPNFASLLQEQKRHPKAHFLLLLVGERHKSDAGEVYKCLLNFTYEDDYKIENKYVAGIYRTLQLTTETISRPPQSSETIP
jgi:hypothetical protein